jgi:hypothetical protein
MTCPCGASQIPQNGVCAIPIFIKFPGPEARGPWGQTLKKKSAPRFFTSEATKYMKKQHRYCKTNCRRRTRPDDRGRYQRRLRSELGSADLFFRSAAFRWMGAKAADLEEQVCATRVFTSEATKYMKTRHRFCKTNCRYRTLPDDRGRCRRRLRCELRGWLKSSASCQLLCPFLMSIR